MATNGLATAVNWMFEHPIVFVITIGLFFAVWIGKKLYKKYRKETIIEEKPTTERFDFADTEEKPVVIHWKGKSDGKEPNIVVGNVIYEEPEEEEPSYVCENCPDGRYHLRKDIFQCPDCGKWFCSWHYQPHINKNHRSDYVVRANDGGGATYTRK